MLSINRTARRRSSIFPLLDYHGINISIIKMLFFIKVSNMTQLLFDWTLQLIN